MGLGNMAGVARSVALLFSDIEGSTRLLQDLGPSFDTVLMEHRAIMRDAFALFGGDERGTEGDSFFVVFPSASAAVGAARKAQLGLSRHTWSNGARVRVRMGVHVGEVRDVADDLVGMAIHRGARIGAAAHGGQVLVSADVVRSIGDAVEGVGWRGLGKHQLKDVGEVELFQLDDDELPGEFPPPRAQGSTRNNLPAQASSFIGRDLELSAITARLAETRLLTLTGAGGAGKSRLALRIGADATARFADGVWFIDLAPINEPSRAAVEQVVAGVLGVSESPNSVLSALAPRAALLVVDNCEHVLEAVTDVVEDVLRHAEHVIVLCTSREPLGVAGEAVYRVPSLADDDAILLFTTRAQAINSAFTVTDANRASVADVVRRLDAIPLALELAAARLGSLSVEQLAERLDQRFRLLSGRASGAMARQRTLQATVDWSYDLLDERAQVVLRRCGVFVGTFDLEAAEAVCRTDDIDEFDVLDLIDQLVAKSLVMAESVNGNGQYRLLETIRQYALDRLLDGGELDGAREAHLDWMTELAASGVPAVYEGVGEQAFLARLDAVGANVRAAVEWALNVGRVHDSATIVFDVVPWFLTRSRLVDGAELAAAVWSHDPSPGDAALLAFATSLTHGNFANPDREIHERCMRAAAGIAESARPWAAGGLQAILATDLLRLEGTAAVADALDRCAPAVEQARRDGSEFMLGLSLQQLSTCHWMNQDLDAAASVMSEALDRMERAQLSAGICRMHTGSARIALRKGELATAERHATDALRIARERSDIGAVINATEVLASIAATQGDAETARAVSLSSLVEVDAVREPRRMASTRNEVAWYSLLLGDTDAARTFASEALELLESEDVSRPLIAHTLAAALRELGEFAEAWSLLVEVVSASVGEYELLLASALEEMGTIRLALGDVSGGATLLRYAEATHAAAGTPPDGRWNMIVESGRTAVGELWEATQILDAATARDLALAMEPPPQQAPHRH